MKKTKLVFGAAAALIIAVGLHDGAVTAYDGEAMDHALVRGGCCRQFNPDNTFIGRADRAISDLEESAGLSRTDFLGDLAKHVLFAVTLPGELVGTGAGKLAYSIHPMINPADVFRRNP